LLRLPSASFDNNFQHFLQSGPFVQHQNNPLCLLYSLSNFFVCWKVNELLLLHRIDRQKKRTRHIYEHLDQKVQSIDKLGALGPKVQDDAPSDSLKWHPEIPINYKYPIQRT